MQDQRGRKAPARSEKTDQSARDADYEDLVACKTCGDFGLAKGRPACGRTGCPYGK